MKWNFITLIPYIYTNNSLKKKRKTAFYYRWASTPTFTRLAVRWASSPEPNGHRINFFWLARHQNASPHVPRLSKRCVLHPKFPKKNTRVGTIFGSDTCVASPFPALPGPRVPRGPHRGTRPARTAGALRALAVLGLRAINEERENGRPETLHRSFRDEWLVLRPQGTSCPFNFFLSLPRLKWCRFDPFFDWAEAELNAKILSLGFYLLTNG